MPGYIIHLTAANYFLNSLPFSHPLNQPKAKNAFLVGNLLPDTVKDKFQSHFRSPDTLQEIVQYPILSKFLDKYRRLLPDPSVRAIFFIYTQTTVFSPNTCPVLYASQTKEAAALQRKMTLSGQKSKKQI